MTTEARPSRPIQNPPVAHQNIQFPHPSEQEFAHLLDYYGVKWRYEATTFPLAWDEQGNVAEAFTPDFYLEEYDLYVELTTLRPRLMRLKHRKIKRLQELYPEVRIKLWSRKDFLYLLERFGLRDRSDELVGSAALENGHARTQ
ncbi:MAG: hypothetical protein V1772_13355 [Chloroflexota bacterium]